MIQFELGGETLARLFPAYLCVNPAGTVLSAGPALCRIAGPGVVGAALAGLVEAVPDLAAAAAAHKTVELRFMEPAISLAGCVIAVAQGYLLAVGILPDRSWPLAQPMQIADFAASDPVVPAIMQAGIQAALIDESRAMAADLAAERERVMELLDRISRTSANMAHEFNNLISIIGLHCERLLRQHAGDAAVVRRVGIIREAAQRGSAMTRSLLAQLTPDIAHASGADELSPTAARGAAPARVLVLDDEPHALEALEELLTDHGYAVTACAGADAALSALACERFDVLLTDVVMPVTSGIELAEAASRLDSAPAIVLMSGHMPDGYERCPEWLFLRKPFDVNQLVGAVAQGCARALSG